MPASLDGVGQSQRTVQPLGLYHRFALLGTLQIATIRTIESKFQYFLQRTRRKGALRTTRDAFRRWIHCNLMFNPFARRCLPFAQRCSSPLVLHTASTLVSTVPLFIDHCDHVSPSNVPSTLSRRAFQLTQKFSSSYQFAH